MQTNGRTKYKNKGIPAEIENKTDVKCSFCGKPKDENFLLVQGTSDCCICDKCIKRAYQIYKNESSKNDTETDMPILKTVRTVAGNREVTINMFEDQYSVTVRRYSQSDSDEAIYETIQTINLTEPSLCLLIRALNNTATEFKINTELILSQLKGDAEIYETFNIFETSGNK